MRGTLLGSLHRLSHLILTMTLCKVSAINIILIFTDKEADGIQILLIYLDHLLGIRLHTFILIILFQKSCIEYPLCQFSKYCYSYDKTQLEVVTWNRSYSVHGRSSWLCLRTESIYEELWVASWSGQWSIFIRISTLEKTSRMWYKQRWQEKRSRNRAGSQKSRSFPNPAHSDQENKGIIPFQGLIKLLFQRIIIMYQILGQISLFLSPVTLQAQATFAFVTFPTWQVSRGPAVLVVVLLQPGTVGRGGSTDQPDRTGGLTLPLWLPQKGWQNELEQCLRK